MTCEGSGGMHGSRGEGWMGIRAESQGGEGGSRGWKGGGGCQRLEGTIGRFQREGEFFV